MNKTTLTLGLLFALLLSASSIDAQHEEKACNINLSIGIRTGSTTWDQGNLNSAASFEYFFTRNQSLEVGIAASYIKRSIANTDVKARFSSVGVDLHYHYAFFSRSLSGKISPTWLYLYGIVGGGYAQEKLKDPNEIPSYLIVESPRNVLGADLGMGAELNFSPHFSLFASVVPRWEFSYKEWVMQGSVGAKFYF